MSSSTTAFRKAFKMVVSELGDKPYANLWQAGYGLYLFNLYPTTALVLVDPKRWKKVPGKKRVKRVEGYCSKDRALRVYTLSFKKEIGLKGIFPKFGRYFTGGKLFRKIKKVRPKRKTNH